MNDYLRALIKKFFGTMALVSIFLAILSAPSWLYVVLGIVIFIFSSSVTHTTLVEEIKKKTSRESMDLNARCVNFEKKSEEALKSENLWKQTLLERTSGFPSLITRINEYEKIRDEQLAHFLDFKKNPAHKAADLVRTEAGRRREAEFIKKRTEAIIEYYELIAPFLLDIKDDVAVDLDREEIFGAYSNEEQVDPVTKLISIEEYRKLPSFERNQLALDRFWKRPNKSKWLIGKLYERYIGYLYEKDGYDVEYHGIQKKLEDLGIDLICRKGNKTILVQCKNWSQFRTIYEKHIFQLFGTGFQFQDAHSGEEVKTAFITTTQLSDIARKFANKLSIELKENFKFDQTYPCIKCNINAVTGEKIYHLPFDQQYDKTKISMDGEMYCQTAKDAEAAGFRRAFRWHGNSDT